MKFIKYRHKWAHGLSPFEYEIIDDTDFLLIEEFVNEKKESHSWSDKYRGVEWEIVDSPPQEWIEKRIKRNEREIEFAKSMISFLKSIGAESGTSS